jgi:hypothetical protein
MFELKPLSHDAIPAALERAERYRLLNEPIDAQSICEDVLAIEADNQAALVMLLLSLTDQFSEHLGLPLARARSVAAKLHDPYSRLYYSGLVAERAAKAHVRRGGVASGHIAYALLRDALAAYEQAAAIAPAENDEGILRWNTCVRLLQSNPQLTPAPQDVEEALLDARVD